MQLVFVHQVPPGRPAHRFDYIVNGDVLTVTHIGEVETVDSFDFTDVPDGSLDLDTVETTLPVQPIRSAVREGGELTVTVLDWRT